MFETATRVRVEDNGYLAVEKVTPAGQLTSLGHYSREGGVGEQAVPRPHDHPSLPQVRYSLRMDTGETGPTPPPSWPCVPPLDTLNVHGTRSDLAGESLGDVRALARERGYRLRVFGEDDDCANGFTDDLDGFRLNVYAQDGKVVWASTF
ncbi:hypothetical protein [Kineosporia succinea]|uniref:Uncharacterized protein n=1 Tax=Kineosporia succinea TaxID=84632 RepID=A0ABT9P941_9ACTN|nr:hypothetical protein [Kineosporia succinea]MDP9828977.1 hypothetical protein [Kineosporia succinea]